MVRALLNGSKTQTRRVVGFPFSYNEKGNDFWQWRRNGLAVIDTLTLDDMAKRSRYGQAGDRLWVRETWQGYERVSYEYDEWEPMESPKDRYEKHFSPVYRADNKNFPEKWFPAIHMPREFSRITLEVTGIRVERLQDISEQDAIAEGVEPNCSMIDHSYCTAEDHGGEWIDYLNMPDGDPCLSAYNSYGSLWEKINGEGSWGLNPWVWVVDFRRVSQLSGIA